MTPENFVYWLNGFVELNCGVPTEQQWYIIVDHLKLTTEKVTPSRAVEKHTLIQHMEEVAELFKENPKWQQDLLNNKIIC